MINIRESIKSNFEGLNEIDILNSINEAIKTNDEIILPGLGVFFEILWNNCDEKLKKNILNIIKKNI